MVTLVSPVQPSNAEYFIVLTPSGITKSVTSLLFKYSFAPLYNGLEQLSKKSILHQAERSDIYTELNASQLLKAFSPIEVTLLPIVTEDKEEQPENL